MKTFSFPAMRAALLFLPPLISVSQAPLASASLSGPARQLTVRREATVKADYLAADQIGRLVLRGKAREGHPVYDLRLKTALIKNVYGNLHLVEIRVQAETLDVLLGWNHPEGEFSFARVPWRDIRAHRVGYGLPEHYDPSGLPLRYKRSPLPPDSRREKLPSESSRVTPWEILDWKSSKPGEVYLIEKERILEVKLPARVQWEARVPAGHVLLSFDIQNNLLFIATNSDQGSRDGELLHPLLTTQVFALSLDGISR
jgi:hypothetical protein